MRPSPLLLSLCLAACVARSAAAADAALPLSKPSFTGRQTVEGDGHGGDGFTVLPLLRNEPPCTVIVLHGLGGSGEEWGYLTLAMSIFSLNYVKFVIPSAPVVPVTYLNRDLPSWFDIDRITDTNALVNRQDLLRSRDRIDNIIDREKAAGVNESRIFIVGFSQGGALALTTYLRNPSRLGGCIGVATWLPLATDYPDALSNTVTNRGSDVSDVLMLHGTDDDVVDFEFARLSSVFLEGVDVRTNFTAIPDGQHVIVSQDILSSLERFISDRAPGTSNFLTTLVDDLTENFDSFSQTTNRQTGTGG